MSQKRKNREKEENAALKAEVDKYLRDFDRAFTEIEAMNDPAEKILKLQSLRYRVGKAKEFVPSEVSSLADIRAKRTVKTYFKKAGLILASLPIVTLPVTSIDVNWTSNRSVDDKRKELSAVVDAAGFKKVMDSHRERIDEMLDTTVRDCDLREMSKSRYFYDALHNCGSLKKRFDAAAAARAALGEEKPQTSVQEASAPEVSAPAATPTRNSPQRKFNLDKK